MSTQGLYDRLVLQGAGQCQQPTLRHPRSRTPMGSFCLFWSAMPGKHVCAHLWTVCDRRSLLFPIFALVLEAL